MQSLRYYTEPSAQSNSPEYIRNRYSRIRGTPVNFSPLSKNNYSPQNFHNPESIIPLSHNAVIHQNITSFTKDNNNQKSNIFRKEDNSNSFSNSRIYHRPGNLKRNEIGWDGLKLSQYIVHNMAQDYEGNARMLQKFEKQAQQNKKNKLHRRFKSQTDRQTYNKYTPNYQNKLRLPTISQGRSLPISNNTNANRSVQILQNQSHNINSQQPLYRNIGTTTHKQYQLNHLYKYVNLQQKYDRLKQRYRKNKQKNKYKIHPKKLNYPLQIQSSLSSKNDSNRLPQQQYSSIDSSYDKIKTKTDKFSRCQYNLQQLPDFKRLSNKLSSINAHLNQNNSLLQQMIYQKSGNISYDKQQCLKQYGDYLTNKTIRDYKKQQVQNKLKAQYQCMSALKKYGEIKQYIQRNNPSQQIKLCRPTIIYNKQQNYLKYPYFPKQLLTSKDP